MKAAIPKETQAPEFAAASAAGNKRSGDLCADAQLNGNQRAEQTTDDTETYAEVWTDAALDGGNHRQNENAIHSPTAQNIAHKRWQTQTIGVCADNNENKEKENDQAGETDVFIYGFDF